MDLEFSGRESLVGAATSSAQYPVGYSEPSLRIQVSAADITIRTLFISATS